MSEVEHYLPMCLRTISIFLPASSLFISSPVFSIGLLVFYYR